MTIIFIELAYLLAGVTFIIALKWLSSPRTARTGNLVGALGMAIAIVATLFHQGIARFEYIIPGMLLGSTIGAVAARKAAMTAMPQMVALFNGVGGGASMLVAWAEFWVLTPGRVALDVPISIMFTTLVGAATLSGSVMAFAKLQELVSGRPIIYRFQQAGNAAVFLAAAGLAVYLILQATVSGPVMAPFYVVLALSLALGVLFVLPVGGADMPVMIALLNAFSGLAAAGAGFVLHNHVLIVSGALVGSSGVLLTRIMCWAMNRSVANVLFGAFGATVQATGAAAGRTAQSIQADEAATLLAYARNVIIAPGYGLAVSRAQNEVRELMKALEARGVSVKFAIHPVAGRMPGHMNVLLAEADIPYDKLVDMEVINGEFPDADVALVLGANDVVNPAARSDRSSPLYGMPILDVDRAKHVIVIKRSLAPGFAGVDNDLFYMDKTRMFFADGREALVRILQELKTV
ncbi:MAG: NAD(P)(+) transhydrogenase (Re/Si-specific) subunit beta [Armatimonadota bacterium]|nr:NAD(P)(+) transhydrogenase (Re/Si-specific) subunit beta [Armatimonadota bacterium]